VPSAAAERTLSLMSLNRNRFTYLLTYLLTTPGVYVSVSVSVNSRLCSIFTEPVLCCVH